LKALITHIDLDGIGNPILAKYYNLSVDRYHFIDYDFLESPRFNELLLKYSKIYITDLAILEESYNILEKANIDFMVFDHHDYTKNFKNKKNVFFDLKKCGTELFFEFLSNKKRVPIILNEFVTIIGVYDLWKLEHPLRKKSEDLNRLFFESLNYWVKGNQYQKYQDFINKQLSKLKTMNKFEFTALEKSKIQNAVLKEKIAIEKAEKSLQFRTDKQNFVFGIFAADRKISNTCTILLSKYKKMDYIVCINTYNGYNGKISVRSRESFNCLMLKNINGHKQAAGGIFTSQFVINLERGIIHELGYKEESKIL